MKLAYCQSFTRFKRYEIKKASVFPTVCYFNNLGIDYSDILPLSAKE